MLFISAFAHEWFLIYSSKFQKGEQNGKGNGKSTHKNSHLIDFYKGGFVLVLCEDLQHALVNKKVHRMNGKSANKSGE